MHGHTNMKNTQCLFTVFPPVYSRCDFKPLTILTMLDGMAASSRMINSFERNLNVIQVDRLKLVPWSFLKEAQKDWHLSEAHCRSLEGFH